MMHPANEMPAEMTKSAPKLPSAMASPPTREPSEMPKNSALLFQANSSALAREIIRQTGLLGWKEQLRDSRTHAEGGFDQPARVERQPQQQQASAEAGKARGRGESDTEAIGHTAADQVTDRMAREPHAGESGEEM